MTARHRLLRGAVVFAGAASITILSAGAAQATGTGTSAAFAFGVLAVSGDAQNNTIVVSRDGAGKILVNGGSVPIAGGQPTVVNTRSILVVAGAGNDTVSFDETNGALPAASLFGGTGNDTLSGGSGGDRLIGQAGADTLSGKGGLDTLFGGTENDTLIGGDADDQAFGEAGDDRLVWNPGDDTDLNEGGDGTDTTEVVGGNGAEAFTETANGTRVRFDRLDPAPFSIDLGAVEKLVLTANGGNDSFSATGNLSTLISTTVDGGSGDDSLLGSNGADTLIGGAGSDFVDGQQGNDTAFLGSENDTFQWDPGDASDTVEGQEGFDTMLFNGANIAEEFTTSANGGRVRFTRNIGNIVMDLDDVERIDTLARGGADQVTVNDTSGTDLAEVRADLSAAGGGPVGDGQQDTVTVRGTSANDVAIAASQGADVLISAQSTVVTATFADVVDTVAAITGDGDDIVDASGITAGSVVFFADGGAGDDVLVGSDGDDTFLGGDGDDVLIGLAGNDTLLGGAGNDVILGDDGNDAILGEEGDDTLRGGAGDDSITGGPGIDSIDGGAGNDTISDEGVTTTNLVAEPDWLSTHARVVDGKTVLDLGTREVTLPVAKLV